MRKALLVTCAVLFISSVCFAQTPGQAPLTEEALAVILGPPATASDSQQGAMAFAAKPPQLLEKATCTASCLGSGTVTCTSTNCSAKNGTCSNLTGSVTCGSTSKYCSTPSYCTRCSVCGDCYSCCLCSGHTGAFCSANC